MLAKALLAIAAFALLTACSSGGGTRPSSPGNPVPAPLRISWQAVTESTDGQPLSDILRYEITVSAQGQAPTSLTATPDTGSVSVPVPSTGAWTVQVTAVSASLGAGETAEAQVMR